MSAPTGRGRSSNGSREREWGKSNHRVSAGHCTIAWKPAPTEWLKRAAGMDAPPAMPCLLDRRAVERLPYRDREAFLSDPLKLCCGILLCWFEPERYDTNIEPEQLRKFLLAALEDLRRASSSESLEEQILDAAARVRQAYGHLPAARMLTAGYTLLPESAKIRGGLVLDIWEALEQRPEGEREEALAFITRLYEGIDLSELGSGAREALCYVHLVALSLLGRQAERDRFFWRSASKSVQRPMLKRRMLRLLQDADPDFEAYRIPGQGGSCHPPI